MGCIQDSCVCSIIRNFCAFLLILLTLSSTHARFLPQGISSSKLIDKDTQVTTKDEYYGKMVRRNVIVGSRPPRCEWKKYCRSCCKCEAIQVPVGETPRSTNATTSGRDISRYKPMCWKCRCGDLTFNP